MDITAGTQQREAYFMLELCITLGRMKVYPIFVKNTLTFLKLKKLLSHAELYSLLYICCLNFEENEN